MTKEALGVGVILAAGGSGSRMNSSTPKQFMLLKGKPLVMHSLELFLAMPQIKQIAIVCNPSYQSLFNKLDAKKITFALPGARRQDSVFNGLQALSAHCSLICVHDAARPYLAQKTVEDVIHAATEVGAAVAAVPVKSTIKEVDQNKMVIKTPDRALLWEIQTPQVISRHLLEEGFKYASLHNITVTDDVSLVELIGAPVRLVEGLYSNIKITTIEDLKIDSPNRQC